MLGKKAKRQRAQALADRIMEQRGRLYRLAYSYVKNEQDALDIVQEAACRLMQTLETRGEPENPDAWMTQVVIHAAIDFVRRHGRLTVGLPAGGEQGREDDHSDLYLFDLLDRLDEKSRAVVVLRVCEQRAFSEIADILGENLGAVKTRYYRALDKLRAEWEVE